MKKKNLMLMLILLFIFTFDNSVLADESMNSDILFSCTKLQLKNNQVNCEIQLNPNGKNIKGIEVNYQFEDVFSYVKSQFYQKSEVLEDNSQGFALLFFDGITEKTTIAKISFFISSNAISGKNYGISLKNILLTDGTKDILETDKEDSIRTLSYLEVIGKISAGNDILQLQDGVNNYTIDVDYDVSSIEIGAELLNQSYQFLPGYGPRTVEGLQVGTNEVHLKIAQNENVIIDYTINVIRSAPLKEIMQENPKTGNIFQVVFVAFMFIFSLFLIFYLFKNNQGENVS